MGSPPLFRGRRQIDPCLARLREPYRYRLSGRTRAVLALAHVVYLLANELAGLRGRGLALPGFALRAPDGRFLRHEYLLSGRIQVR